jgi:hypothetical protein
MPLRESLLMMQVFDQIREQGEFVYPDETPDPARTRLKVELFGLRFRLEVGKLLLAFVAIDLRESLLMMQVFDQIREQGEFVYPEELETLELK